MQFHKEELISLKVKPTWLITFLNQNRFLLVCQFLMFYFLLLSLQLGFITSPTFNTEMPLKSSQHVKV